MNVCIEHLNQWGGVFLNFAGAMLWQAGLLIGLLLAVDWLWARKIRATLRYGLWLVVLVKLLLPPTLALPTGAAWWLRSVKPVPAPLTAKYAATYGTETAPMMDMPSALPVSISTPAMNGAGWALLVAGAVSAFLLLWLMFRWWHVAQKVRRACDLEYLDPGSRSKLVLAQPWSHSPVRLKITDDRMSPAVCGLFHPVILLPRPLVEKLSAGQLRAVLLHEWIHLRRGDVWVNCAQTLLQLAYWWHPLVWLANARIRRVREEAVDDAVMLALREDAEIYAPTLLEVVKWAWSRPLMSLGLVGIMESRSALRQRLERLVNFRAPRKAGLTFASLCGLAVFSAVALPMGEAPGAAENGTASPPVFSSPLPKSASLPGNTNPPAILITGSFYHLSATELQKLVSDLSINQAGADKNAWWLASPAQFSRLENSLKESGHVRSTSRVFWRTVVNWQRCISAMARMESHLIVSLPSVAGQSA